jgi:hypothetical protein
MPGLYDGEWTHLAGGALDELLTGVAGPVMRDAYERGERVAEMARHQVRPSRVRTGQWASARIQERSLRDSIVVKFATVSGGGPVVVVQAAKHYALFVDQGTRPHIIRPRRKKVLAFWWEKQGQWTVRRRVNHPGGKPTYFLSGSLVAAGDGSHTFTGRFGATHTVGAVTGI